MSTVTEHISKVRRTNRQNRKNQYSRPRVSLTSFGLLNQYYPCHIFLPCCPSKRSNFRLDNFSVSRKSWHASFFLTKKQCPLFFIFTRAIFPFQENLVTETRKYCLCRRDVPPYYVHCLETQNPSTRFGEKLLADICLHFSYH